MRSCVRTLYDLIDGFTTLLQPDTDTHRGNEGFLWQRREMPQKEARDHTRRSRDTLNSATCYYATQRRHRAHRVSVIVSRFSPSSMQCHRRRLEWSVRLFIHFLCQGGVRTIYKIIRIVSRAQHRLDICGQESTGIISCRYWLTAGFKAGHYRTQMCTDAGCEIDLIWTSYSLLRQYSAKT